MIVHGCIEIHHKDCGGWIIVTGFGFINFATSIPRNFTGGGIRYPCRKCQNKKYLYPDVKGFMENYLCWYAHGELFVCNKNMGERVVGSTSSASNVHEVANDTLILTGIWLWMQ